MLNQIGLEFLSLLLSYGPTIIAIAFDITILVFAILVLKKNSYKYGITLMLTSIISLASSITYISIQYPFLWYRLEVELGLPVMEALLILNTWGFVFFGLNTTSAILLVISIILIYKTHKKDRTVITKLDSEN